MMYMYSFVEIAFCLAWLQEVYENQLQVLTYGCPKRIIWIHDLTHKHTDDIFVTVLFWAGGSTYQRITLSTLKRHLKHGDQYILQGLKKAKTRKNAVTSMSRTGCFKCTFFQTTVLRKALLDIYE